VGEKKKEKDDLYEKEEDEDVNIGLSTYWDYIR